MAAKVDGRDCAITKQDSQTYEKDCSSGTKVKRKSRSARRRLNAMMSNASLHFSDTDSEGELAIITSKIDKINPTETLPQMLYNVSISVTKAEADESGEPRVNDDLDHLIAEGEARSQHSNFVENLTDVDEIYSDAETEDKDSRKKLKVVDNDYQTETDLEDIEADEDIQPTIYVAPREDILNEISGEMITTKEGDGPFSVEVRNRLSREEVSIKNTEDMPDMPNTDSEDMEGSEDEKLNEAASHEIVYEDFNVLAASQIVMTNQTENNLLMPNNIDEAISDSHTDVEDID